MKQFPAPSCAPVPDAFNVYQRWQQRDDAENFTRNLAFLQKNVITSTSGYAFTQAAQWVFCHVPKTGGTTLENILARNVPLKDILRINAPVLNHCPCSYGATGRHPRLVMGHHPLHGLVYQLLADAPLFHMTFIRHPLARVVSWFNYLKTRPEHLLHARIQSMDLDEFLQQPDLVEIRNGQCRRLTGHLHQQTTPEDATLFQQAKQVLDTAFSFVGTTERFDESLLVVKKQLGLTDIFYQPLNTSKKIATPEALNQSQRQCILNMNQADIALHEWACQRLSALIDKYLPPHSLERFRKNNRRWQRLLDEM